MMRKVSIILFTGLAILASACNLGASAPGNSGGETAPPPTNTPKAEEPTPVPPTPTAEIVHLTMPSDPVYVPGQNIRDCNSGAAVSASGSVELNSFCDNWSVGAVERPFDENLQYFFSQVDIIGGQFGEDKDWMYASIELYPGFEIGDSVKGVYGIEVDVDIDSRGDYLILVSNPVFGDWSTAGVQVWADSNHDIGSAKAGLADNEDNGDGYDQLLFDSGVGDDPDLAWARATSGSVYIEFAFKRSLISNDASFKWWLWSAFDSLPPGQFDFNDKPENQDTMFGLDNSCAWLYGLPPTSGIPNLCNFQKTPTPTPKPGGEKNISCAPDEYYSEITGKCEPFG